MNNDEEENNANNTNDFSFINNVNVNENRNTNSFINLLNYISLNNYSQKEKPIIKSKYPSNNSDDFSNIGINININQPSNKSM